MRNRNRLRQHGGVLAISTVMIMLLAGCSSSGVSWSPGGTGNPPVGVGAVGLAASPTSPSAAASSVRPKPSAKPTVKPSPKPKPSHSPTPTVTQCVTPKHGTFTVASGGSKVSGRGDHLYHYEVQVEKGIGQSAARSPASSAGPTAAPGSSSGSRTAPAILWSNSRRRRRPRRSAQATASTPRAQFRVGAAGKS